MPKTPESSEAPMPDNPGPKTGSADQGPSKPEEIRAASATPAGASSGAQQGSRARSAGRQVAARKGQFLIAARRLNGMQAMGLLPLQFSIIEQTLRSSPDIEVVDSVGPKAMVGMMADGLSDAPSVLVARMTEQKAQVLHQQAQGHLIVERDQSLALLDVSFQQPLMVTGFAPGTGPVLAAVITVLGKDNLPIKDAEVYLFGSMMPVKGLTDERGSVTLSLFGETEQSIRALYVKPKSDYWTFYQKQPEISKDEVNIVSLRPLSESPSLANFPQQQILGWGQKLMRLDQLPGTYRGQGVKIAIIDSGAATTHEDLRNIRSGFDVINKKVNPNTWNEDSVAHGSHCAGIICGADNASGVRGFAPDAEVHVCKLFPGGQISQLIDALEYCIEKQIDVVNMSLGGAEYSEALEQQIQRARRAGVACIVAAGNSGGGVQYPASSPNVLAVAAIGHINQFPADSYHTQTMTNMMDANGYYAASFSCFGPEIGVCAPGVAIVSSVPPNNFAIWDGTSMAAPHVTGVAALVLAHHPDFQGAFKTRGPERIERLFQVLKMSARPLNVGDARRTGFGIPDVLTAVGLQAPAGIPNRIGAPAMSGLGTQSMDAIAGMPLFAQSLLQQKQVAPQTWIGTPWYLPQTGIGMTSFDPSFMPYGNLNPQAGMQYWYTFPRSFA